MAPHYHVISMRGHVDIARYPEFRSEFMKVPDGVPVLVDLRGASGVDSTFLSEMLMFRRRHDALVSVVVTSETHLAKIFEIAGMDTKMDVYPTRAEALKALGITVEVEEEDVPSRAD